MSESTTILIGTTKGAFLLTGTGREGWSLTGPHCDGWPINHVVGDAETGTIWAGGGGPWSGAGVWRSDDQGKSWTLAKLSKGQIDEWAANDPEMAKFMNWTPVETKFDGLADSVWSLHRANGTLYAGTRPAQLLSSTDGGKTWEKSEPLANFPDRDKWNPGAAGLVLHSIVTDPKDAKKIWLGISSSGVFATEDGGETWERRNRMSNAEAHRHHDHPAAPRDGETGHCVHNIGRAPDGDLLYQQNHHGVFRSSDGGRSWDDITEGLPSTFGFPIAVHPRDGQTAWVLPLNGDTEGRFPPDASAAVWKTTDGGATWQDKRTGLPQGACFFTVLRQAMAVDRATPAGLYFGTNTGSIFASLDEGETWDEIARHLPTVLGVEVLQR
ncbi:MAG: exo-alpha-sialidase [Pseudooceanicola sp.]|nr:exo-alpha-sialidase [Pseudooceanicola sp.]